MAKEYVSHSGYKKGEKNMGCIYKITNKINQKIYIGKTIREPLTRWKEHLQYANHQQERYNTPLYSAMRKYGIENFDFEVIENNILNEQELNRKEQQYIQFYNATSHENGYNVTIGGDGGRNASKLTENIAEQIRLILLDTTNIESFNEIGKHFHISGSVIRAINTGESWFKEDYKNLYPLRKYSTNGLSINKKEYKNIVYDLQFTKLTLKEICNKYNLSENQIVNINNGKCCYNGQHEYYKDVYIGDFPIRSTNQILNLSQNTFIPILKDCLFTNLSMAKLGEKYDYNGNTLQYIFMGKRHKELTQNFITPIRQHLEENRKIFKELYEIKKGGC